MIQNVSVSNPSTIFNLILNGHDLTEFTDVKLKTKESIKDLRTTSTTLAITLNGQDEISITRFLIKPATRDWSKLHPEVAKVCQKLEKLNKKAVCLIRESEEIEKKIEVLDAQNGNEKDMDDKRIIDLLDMNQIFAAKEDEFFEIEETINQLREILFCVLQEYNSEIYNKLYQIYLREDGPLELWVSELIQEKIKKIPIELANLFKQTIISMGNGNGNGNNK
ncbi:hypothetical protein KAU09_00335 [Candidatus Parcubacteria bacterium]|nr:hypothetical protein [Candidatus Parcubacteria bacterium]